MRVLHTSDWHLGRSLHRADLAPAQARFLDHLVETTRSERVDLVVVAGDIYDRAIPPLDAVALCEDALIRLRDAGAAVVLVSGNHDSPGRLGFGSRLLDPAGVHVRTRVAGCATPVLLQDRHGEVAVYALPYLEPAAVRTQLPPVAGAEPPEGVHHAVVGHALAAVRADLAGRRARSIVVAHGWVHGGSVSESERDIGVGGVGHVPASLFDAIDYVALGHLHGPQSIAEHLRYSGSPLPYSFSEASHRKASWLVELGPGGLTTVEDVPAPVHRRLSVLSGSLAELLDPARFTDAEQDFLAVTLTDTGQPAGAMDRLSRRFPHVLKLAFAPVSRAGDAPSYQDRVVGRDDLTIATGFVDHVRGSAATAVEAGLLRAALEATRLRDTETAVAPRAAMAEAGRHAGAPDVELVA